MGIEINGTYESFKDSLEARDFVYMSSYESLHRFYGRFANEIVTLNILASPKSQTVCKVIVFFPERENWNELKKDYFSKKKMYASKYPLDKDFEFFSSPYDEGDGYEMRAVTRNKCRFISFYLALGGHITVEIDESARIKIEYEDRANIKKAKEELEQNSIDDI
ncbi:MAG: hypothetical protein IKH59_09430 [Bacteroidaceae bacterium]|nr:hypothetical protein [Bacteroidaceae bacterium]